MGEAWVRNTPAPARPPPGAGGCRAPDKPAILIVHLTTAGRHQETGRAPTARGVDRNLSDGSRRLREIARAVARPPRSPVLTAVIGTRLPVLLLGALAVTLVGTVPAPTAEALWRVSPNELVNLQARWDTDFYYSIATTGYHWNPAVFLHQNVVFFPLYPLLMRWGGHTPRRPSPAGRDHHFVGDIRRCDDRSVPVGSLRAGRRESVARNLADVHVPVCAVLLRRLYGVPVLVLDRERVLRDAAGIPAAGGAGGLRGGADPPERVLDRAAALVARDDRSG